MERGCPPDSFRTSNSRVSSPSAAKIGARARGLVVTLFRPLRDILFNVLHLLSPTTIIHAERFQSTVAGDFVEAGLREQKQRTGWGLLQFEFDERRRFLRVIHFGIDGIRMPGEGKKPFWLHFLRHGLPFHVLIAGVSNVAR